MKARNALYSGVGRIVVKSLRATSVEGAMWTAYHAGIVGDIATACEGSERTFWRLPARLRKAAIRRWHES